MCQFFPDLFLFFSFQPQIKIQSSFSIQRIFAIFYSSSHNTGTIECQSILILKWNLFGIFSGLKFFAQIKQRINENSLVIHDNFIDSDGKEKIFGYVHGPMRSPKKRCCATVEAQIIAGYTMMRVKNPKHICDKINKCWNLFNSFHRNVVSFELFTNSLLFLFVFSFFSPLLSN